MNNRTFKTSAPFGVATKRFAKIGFHPELDRSGAMKREITKTGPGSYNPHRAQCKSKKGMDWKNKKEMEEFSQFLGFRNANVLNERTFYKTMRGPGSHDINNDVYKKQSSSVYQNVGFGSGKRICKPPVPQNVPPPDAYFRKTTQATKPKKSFSKLPTFEWDGFQDRFKSEQKSFHLPPNRYEIHDDKNTVDIVKKGVSLRGPYDCFTGPRDNSTIKNHFAAQLSQGPDYFYIKPSDADHLIQHPSKQRYGLFLKSNRFQTRPTVRSMLNDISLCYKDPNHPGPASYDLSSSSIKKLPETIHPFNSSNIHARPPIDWRISPGPARYNPKAARCVRPKRPSWVFLSKQDRNLIKVVKYTLFGSD